MSVCRRVVAAVAMLLAVSGCSAEKPQDVDVGNSETRTMVLPYGSKLVEEQVTLPDEEGFAVGDVVDLPGMWADPAAVALPEDAPGCPTDGYALLFPPDPEDGSVGT